VSKKWDNCREVEAKSVEILRAWMLMRNPNAIISSLETECRELTISLQAFGDWFVIHQGESFGRLYELKAEMKTTGNIFLETWENRNNLKQGWWQKCQAEWLYYHFLDSDTLLTVKMSRLRSMDRSSYQERKMEKYNSRGDVWGMLVPIDEVLKRAGGRIFHPKSELAEGNSVPEQVPLSNE